MGHKWIIDVLADLQSFAVLNEMPVLAAKLEETLVVARREYPIIHDDALFVGTGGQGETGILHKGLGTSGRA